VAAGGGQRCRWQSGGQGGKLFAGGRRGSRGVEGAQRKKKEEKKSKVSCGKLKRSRDFPVK
jgi:hypothetical protein